MTRRRRHDEQIVPTGAPSSPDGALDPADLRMLASAIAGRTVAVSPAADGVAHTDGTTIFVGAQEPTTTVCVQAAMIGAGSLHSPALRRVLARKGAAPRYVTLEARRATAALRHLLPPSVVAAAREHWPTEPSTGPVDSAAQAVHHKSVPDAPSVFGTLRRAALSAPPDSGAAGGGEETEEAIETSDGENGVERSSLLSIARFDNAFTRMIRDIIGPAASEAEDDNGGIETSVTSATRGNRSGKAKPVLARLAPRAAAAPDARGFSYPEWDFRAGAYRPRWCSVVELDPAPQPEAEPLHLSPDRELVRAALRVTTVREPHNRQHAGDGLDVGSLVRFAVSHRVGETPDDRVMRARLRTASELSVLLLIDCSGSGAETAGGAAIWEHQRQVAAHFLAAFDAAGARVSAYGFNSRGRTVQFLRIKSFAGRYGAAARARLAALQPSGYTRMGAAIRHATSLLSSEGGSDRRLLVVVSDGFPYDDEYEGAYAENDARHALEEAAAQGVGCACFTVESPTEAPALERLWGSATYVQLSSGRRWAEPVEATLQAAMRRAASLQKTRTSTTQGASA
jgi:Mg-chelatase subunit ChlD